jgi:hypothetical protein
MRNFILIAIVACCCLRCSEAVERADFVKAEFPGSSLKWIHIAEAQFRRQKLDVDKYTVCLIYRDDSVVVMLENPGTEDIKSYGNPGPLPEYEVEISKKDSKIIHANYIR